MGIVYKAEDLKLRRFVISAEYPWLRKIETIDFSLS
jgi:hypothetical protein